MKKIKEEIIPQIKWEKLKQYAQENSIPFQIEDRDDIDTHHPPNRAFELFYDKNFYQLEVLFSDYVHRKRTIYYSFGSAIVGFFLNNLWSWVKQVF